MARRWICMYENQRKMERNILGIQRNERIRNSVVREQTGITDIC